MLYVAQWQYVSGRRRLVPGETVELTEAEVAWLLADSPGVVIPVTERAPEQAPADRMHRKGGRRGNQ